MRALEIMKFIGLLIIWMLTLPPTLIFTIYAHLLWDIADKAEEWSHLHLLDIERSNAMDAKDITTRATELAGWLENHTSNVSAKNIASRVLESSCVKDNDKSWEQSQRASQTKLSFIKRMYSLLHLDRVEHENNRQSVVFAEITTSSTPEDRSYSDANTEHEHGQTQDEKTASVHANWQSLSYEFETNSRHVYLVMLKLLQSVIKRQEDNLARSSSGPTEASKSQGNSQRVTTNDCKAKLSSPEDMV
jgi:hypothetical protein